MFTKGIQKLMAHIFFVSFQVRKKNWVLMLIFSEKKKDFWTTNKGILSKLIGTLSHLSPFEIQLSVLVEKSRKKHYRYKRHTGHFYKYCKHWNYFEEKQLSLKIILTFHDKILLLLFFCGNTTIMHKIRWCVQIWKKNSF